MKTRHHALLAFSAFALMGAVGSAQAQGTGSPDPSTRPSSSATAGSPDGSLSSDSSAAFDKLDRNRDGMVSKTEAGKDKAVEKSFSTLDQSKDGKLDYAEFAQFEAGATTDDATSSTPPTDSTMPKY